MVKVLYGLTLGHTVGENLVPLAHSRQSKAFREIS